MLISRETFPQNTVRFTTHMLTLLPIYLQVCINDVAANEKGCKDVAKEIQNKGRKSCVAIADVTKRSEVADMIQTSVKELGDLNTMYGQSMKRQIAC